MPIQQNTHHHRRVALLLLFCSCQAWSMDWSDGANANPQVLAVGKGRWLCVWGTKDGIKITRSSDDGRTWSAPARVKPKGFDALFNAVEPILFADSEGNVYLTAYDGVATSSDAGETWSWIRGKPSFTDEPEPLLGRRLLAIAFGRGGTEGRIYTSSFYGKCGVTDRFVCSDVYVIFSYDRGRTWTPSILMSSILPPKERQEKWPLHLFESGNLLTDGLGLWIACWSSREGCSFSRRSLDDGKTWNEPVVVKEGLGSPFIQVSKSGTLLGVWCEQEDGGDGPPGPPFVRAIRSSDKAATWGSPVTINSGQSGSYAGKVRTATDNKKHWIVSWDSRKPSQSEDSMDSAIFVATSSDDAKTWCAPRTITSQPQRNTVASISTDNEGIWIAVWNKSERTGRFDEIAACDVLMAGSSNNGATWSDPKTISKRPG